MKILFTVFVLLFGFSTFADPTPTLSERLRQADLVAFVSVIKVTTTIQTNADGATVAILVRECAPERTLKGTRHAHIKIRQEIVQRESDDARLEPGGRFLLFGKQSGDSYIPASFYGLSRVFITLQNTD